MLVVTDSFFIPSIMGKGRGVKFGMARKNLFFPKESTENVSRIFWFFLAKADKL